MKKFANAVLVFLVGATIVGTAVTPAQAATFEDDVYVLTNEQREATGGLSLIRDATLDNAAQQWANEMSRMGSMVHSSNDWRSARIPAGWDTNGENIAYGYASASNVMTAWMNSAGHKANIVNPRYTRMGVGYVSTGRFWVQIFAGYPSDRQPQLSPAATPTVSGTAKVGQTLTASAGTWASGTSFAYQWRADGTAISGATGTTLPVTSSMVGSSITVTVTGSKSGYRPTSKTSAGTAQAVTNLSVSRISGSDRYAVATSISRTSYPSGARTVYVAAGSKYPDALSAGPAAIAEGAPLLLVEPTRLSPEVEAEIERLHPSRIVIVGGVNSVSEDVEARLAGLATTVRRIEGADRYEVSRSLAQYAFGSNGADRAYVSNGNNFPDALSAGSPAGRDGTPVLLVNGGASGADQATISQLDSLGASAVKIAGGTASVSTGIEADLRSAGNSVIRLAGPDRYAASIAINAEAFSASTTAYIATGVTFPDALAGSVLAGSRDAPLFVVPTTCVPRGVLAQFSRMGVRDVVVLGGLGSVDARAGALVPCGW